MERSGKISILFLGDDIAQATAGSEQHLSFLLWNLPRERFEVYFALLRNGQGLPPDFSPVPPQILNLHSFKKPSEVLQAVRTLRRLIKEHSIKIVQAFFPDSEFLASLAMLSGIGCQKVIARRNMGHSDSRLLLCRNRLTGKLSGSYLVNSEAIKRRMVLREHIAPERIKIIYNPVNQKRIAEGMAVPPERTRWGLAEGDLIVGIVANIRPVKDYQTFLKAAARVAGRVGSSKFLVVGSVDEHYWMDLRLLTENPQLKDRIVFTGAVGNPFPLIRLFDVGVLSSWSEGLSNSLIEYAAAGIAIVATDVGGNREIVEDGRTGFLVPAKSEAIMADRIVELLENPEKRRAMGERGRAGALVKFSQEGVLYEYVTFYTSLARSGPEGRGA
jgi:glycosyltransferase involved in cell wall biosynthesis